MLLERGEPRRRAVAEEARAYCICFLFLAKPRKGDYFGLSARLNFYEIIHSFPFATMEST